MSRISRAVVAGIAALSVMGLAVVNAPTSSAAPQATSTLPNPLKLKSGAAVTTTAVWETTRRPELLADFRNSIYGQPLPKPTAQTFSVATTDYPKVTRKIVTANITGPNGKGSFAINVFIPKGVKPSGAFLLLDHRGQASADPDQASEYFPVATITGAGFVAASINTNNVAPDDAGSFRTKMIDLFYPADSELPKNATGAVGAWAWSASRAMDYFVTDAAIPADKVAVIGHSRSGKASLWAGAQDTRFAAVISNDSGSTGAKLARRSSGESVSAINGQFPHWFSANYKTYNDKEASLPIDQHELLALVAPRRVVVASATEDATADPEGEFLSYVSATPVYKLYGLGNNGLSSTNYPPATNKDFRGDAMSYHLTAGGHGLGTADWNLYLKGNLFARATATAAVPARTAAATAKPKVGRVIPSTRTLPSANIQAPTITGTSGAPVLRSNDN